MSFPNLFKKFLLTKKQDDLFKEVSEDRANLANYNVNSVLAFGSVYSGLKDVPAMLQDPIIASALAIIMETAFQTNNEQKVFWVNSPHKEIREELENWHNEFGAQQFCLNAAYNLLLWGNLPCKTVFDPDYKLVGVKPIPDFTKVTPIVIANTLVGYYVDGEFKFPFEYVFGQLQYYKDFGGVAKTNSVLVSGDNTIQNEFVVAPSYLSTAAKAWRNVNIIEDALLLMRMDQSNYYRILSVNVGPNVYSKSAVKVLNFYRNLFKRVRRVSYDSAGMAAKGTGQEFEVVIPKSESGGVEVTDVGGKVDIAALKDLETQYNKLFSSLRIQPSMIGFSSKVPASLGTSVSENWDQRFAKTCKTLVYSTLKMIHDLDKIYLRSHGYDVEDADWTYGTVAASVIEDKERAAAFETAVDTLEKMVKVLKDSDVAYDHKYLVKSILGGPLTSAGIDANKLLNPEEVFEVKKIESSLYSGFTFSETQKKVLTAANLMKFESEEKKPIFSGVKPGNVTYSVLKSNTALVSNDSDVNLTDYIQVAPITGPELKKKAKDKPSVMETIEIDLPVCVTNDVDTRIKVSDLEPDVPHALLSNAFIVQGRLVITSREDLIKYLVSDLNGLNYCLVDNLWSVK